MKRRALKFIIAAGIVSIPMAVLAKYTNSLAQISEMEEALARQTVQFRNISARPPQLRNLMLLPSDLDCTDFYKTKVFGEDDRLLETAKLNEAEEVYFSGTQRLECRAHGGNMISTVTLSGDATHGIGVAHAFYNPEKSIEMSAKDCVFNVYDRNGNEIDSVPLKRYKSRWKDKGNFGLANDDLMMFELERKPRGISRGGILVPMAAKTDMEVMAVGFHRDLESRTTKVKSYGKIYRKAGTIHDPMEKVFITDLDTAEHASGAPIIDVKTGRIVGVHRGSYSTPDMRESKDFDRQANYNTGVMFDDQFIKDYEAFRNETPI